MAAMAAIAVVIIVRFMSLLFLELDVCSEFNGERTEIATRHDAVLDVLCLLLGDEFSTCDAALGTSLVEEVDNCATEREMLVHIPVHTAKGLPVTIEVVCLVDVGVGLAEVAETGPELQFRSNHVAWVKFDEHLWHLCHNITRSVNFALISVAEHHRGLILLICRLLVCEEGVQLESLERTHHGVGGPSPGL